MLRVEGLTAGYGGVPVLHAVDLEVGPGQVVALLGANGSGRSTVLRAVSGLLRPTAGRVLLDGEPLHRLPASSVVGRGLAHVPEGRRVFGRMSVEENLRTGGYVTGDGALAEVLERFPVLAERRRQLAGTLSGGEQQLLALGRALMSRPRVLLLDEPTTGLAPLAVRSVLGVVRELAEAGTAVLLVEQDAGLALGTADAGVLLETGRVVASGSPEELRPLLGAAYLGD